MDTFVFARILRLYYPNLKCLFKYIFCVPRDDCSLIKKYFDKRSNIRDFNKIIKHILGHGSNLFTANIIKQVSKLTSDSFIAQI